MLTQQDLIAKVQAYNPEVDTDLLGKAYIFAIDKHGAQLRASGEPYFSHPIAVAEILIDMRLDTASIITALLHDTIEDTDVTYADIEKKFGTEIAKLVDGVTKLTRIEMQTAADKQAENFRKLVLAMSEDIRVLLIKLADRLHNMRTLHYITKPAKRIRIATETLEIYSPLAQRIGIQAFYEDLQDLAFRELNSDARESIMTRLSFLRSEGGNLVDKIITTLGSDFKRDNLEIEIAGREKTAYSIWRKMQRKNVAFEQLSDIMAFRILTDNVAECYHALGILHSKYSVVPGRFKDYISTPKRNGYQSIHTTIIGPEKHRIEVQIRTMEMHAISELGVAAHWAYKQGAQNTEGKQYQWLRELLDILENAQRPDEFLEHTKLELFQDQVFCFTPKGELIELPRGSTPIDFAYAVHSQVGDTCVGAKVNGRIVPLTTELDNGDQVEIHTSKNQTPSPMWERYVVTGKARARIRRFVRMQQRGQFLELGKSMLQRIFKQEGYEFTEKAFKGVLKQLQVEEIDDIFVAVGSGHKQARDVFYTIFPSHKEKSKDEKQINSAKDLINKPKGKGKKKKGDPIPIKGLIPGMAVHFARCCHPLPGDPIVGIVTTGRGVTIHTIDCETLEAFADAPERWIDVSWDTEAAQIDFHIGRLRLTLMNERGSLGTLSNIIGKNDGNITNLKITNRTMDFYELYLDVQVRDATHLSDVIAALRASSTVTDVKRARTS